MPTGTRARRRRRRPRRAVKARKSMTVVRRRRASTLERRARAAASAEAACRSAADRSDGCRSDCWRSGPGRPVADLPFVCVSLAGRSRFGRSCACWSWGSGRRPGGRVPAGRARSWAGTRGGTRIRGAARGGRPGSRSCAPRGPEARRRPGRPPSRWPRPGRTGRCAAPPLRGARLQVLGVSALHARPSGQQPDGGAEAFRRTGLVQLVLPTEPHRHQVGGPGPDDDCVDEAAAAHASHGRGVCMRASAN